MFVDIGWAPPAKLSEDIGTDFITFARDTTAPDHKDDAWDLGAPVMLQIKGSQDEYLTPKDTRDGDAGWWFAESKTYHFDHWLSFGLPYLLVLVDVTNQIGYWAEVSGDAIVATGKGRKIFVPAAQSVDTANLDALNKIAISRRRNALEGAVWKGQLNVLGPAARLRNALVVPRLVAPHPNRAVEKLSFEEAVALVMRNRYNELEYRGSQGQCPKSDDWETHKDWGWRFVHALRELITKGDSTRFPQLTTEARHRFERDASIVVHACAAYARGDIEEALATLVPSRATQPADRGWLHVHRAAFLLERDQLIEAAKAAKKALAALKACDGDLSVSAIRGGAASILYTVAGFAAGDVEATVIAQDHAGTWWRAQDISWSLEKDLKLRFDGWADNSTIHFISNTARSDLSVVGWNAALSGSWCSWRHIAALNAQLTSTSSNDPLLLETALSDLIIIGEKKAAKDAARKIWMDGPAESLQTLVISLTTRPWSKRDEGSTMAVLSQAGDLLTPGAADNVVQRIIDLLNTDGAVRVHGSSWSSRWREVDSVFHRVLQAASSASHKKIADFVATEFAAGDQSVAHSCIRIASALTTVDVGVARGNRLLQAATARNDSYGIALLEILAPQTPGAVAELRSRADAGNENAIRSLLVAGSNDQTDFLTFGESAARAVRKMILDAVGKDGSRMMSRHSNDQLDDLTLAAINTNDENLWKEVTDALEVCVIDQTQQQQAVRRLASNFQKLPPLVQDRLRKLAPNLRGMSIGFSPGRNDFAAAVTHLRIAADTVPDLEVEALLLSQRRTNPVGFVQNLGAWNSPKKLPFLATMIVDENPRVRSHAAFNIIEHADTFPEDCDRALSIIRTAQMQESGYALADGIAKGLAAYPGERFSDVETALRSHPSAVIRGRFVE